MVMCNSNPFETSKAVVVARMISRRYRCESLRAHWSNDQGYCQETTCSNIKGDIEHILVNCPALDAVRTKMCMFWKSKTEHCFPELNDILNRVKICSPTYMVHFLVYPCSFPEIIMLGQMYGHKLIEHVNYLTRTYIFHLHNEKQKMHGNQKKNSTVL